MADAPPATPPIGTPEVPRSERSEKKEKKKLKKEKKEKKEKADKNTVTPHRDDHVPDDAGGPKRVMVRTNSDPAMLKSKRSPPDPPRAQPDGATPQLQPLPPSTAEKRSASLPHSRSTSTLSRSRTPLRDAIAATAHELFGSSSASDSRTASVTPSISGPLHLSSPTERRPSESAPSFGIIAPSASLRPQDEALLMAARRGSVSDCKKALERGADPWAVDSRGRTPLHWAAAEGEHEVVALLLKTQPLRSPGASRADGQTADKEGNTPLQLALLQAQSKVVQVLLPAQAPELAAALHQLLRLATWKANHSKVLKVLLSGSPTLLSVAVNVPDAADGLSLVQRAAGGSSAHRAAAALLIKAGADVGAPPAAGEPALWLAAAADDAGLVRTLLAAGADVNQPGPMGGLLLDRVSPRSDVYKVIRTHLKNAPGGERKIRHAEAEPIVARSFKELPADIQRASQANQVTAEQVDAHWDAFCLAVALLSKRRICATQAELEAERTRRRAAGPDPQLAEIEYEIRFVREKLNPTPPVQYRRQQEAGKGAFGAVFAATAPDGSRVAIKRMAHSAPREQLSNLVEAYHLRTLAHPNIVAVRAVHEAVAEHELWLVTELLEGGTLEDVLACETADVAERHVAFVAAAVLRALAHMHAASIAHRDLKPQNVMLSTAGDIKLIDFGLACDVSTPRNELAGSPYFVPPEMILRKPHGCAADIWSLGVCVLHLANGRVPHAGQPLRAMMEAAAGRAPSLERPERFSPAMRAFCAALVTIDLAARPTAASLLKDPFIAKACDLADMRNLLAQVFTGNNLRNVGVV